MTTWRAWAALVPLTLAAFGCRTDQSAANEAAALAATPVVWYDAAGSGAACDPKPAPSCPATTDPQPFVDLCVAKGFQAKTCGCTVRCSGKTNYVAPPSGLALASTSLTTPTPTRTCGDDDKSYIVAVEGRREPDGLLTRCLDTHVCNGNIGWCVGDSLKASTRLRALAREGCESEVYGTICKDGYLDSLTCPEADIQKLSNLWAEFYAKDSSVKRCIRNVVCSDEKTFCTSDALAQAMEVKAAVNHDGCEYWLRTLCNLNGGRAW